MIYLTAGLAAVALTAAAIASVHKLQSLSYYVERGYFKIFASDYFVCLVILNVAIVGLELTFLPNVIFAQLAIAIVCGVVLAATRRRPKLVFTKRAIRLVIAIFLFSYAICLFVPFFLMPMLAPLIAVAAFYALLPVERAINNRFKKQAYRKLQNVSFTKIAVVGSFAKTSVKQILQQLLPNSVACPNSCNTPMGICKFVNSTDFEGVKYAIFEMGARKTGDIKELCDIVNPDCAVFCGVAAQHLETFKTFENIAATKREILRELPECGFVILNGKNDIARQSVDIGKCKKVVALAEANFEVELTSVSRLGTAFDMTIQDNRFSLQTPLLGQSHIENIALCACAAYQLGMTVDELIPKIASLAQIKHRMEIVEGAVTVIDDGYNANIAGIENCAKTLSMLEGYKIAISQDIVEGGSRQAELNLQTGKLLGQCCNAVIVCGINSQQLYAGAKENCPRVEIAESLDNAVCLAQKYYDNNTYVIFQNDIP